MPQDLRAVAWPVRTARLALRPATAADGNAVFEVRSQPSVSQWLPTAPTDRGAFVARFTDAERLAKTLVLEAVDGELIGPVIGDLFLAVGDAWAQAEVAGRARGVEAEIGWALAPAWTGRGLATEAVRELLRVCFADLRVRRVIAHSFADNVASWRLMERLGMRREAYSVRDSLHRSGVWLDGVSYALLAEEWRVSEDRPDPPRGPAAPRRPGRPPAAW